MKKMEMVVMMRYHRHLNNIYDLIHVHQYHTTYTQLTKHIGSSTNFLCIKHIRMTQNDIKLNPFGVN